MKNSVYIEVNEISAAPFLSRPWPVIRTKVLQRNRLRTNVKHISVEGNEENESSEVRSKVSMIY